MNDKSRNNAVVHFEMPAHDKARVSKFYTDVFGWEMQQLDEDFGNYVMAMTTKSDKDGPLEKGMINGGFFDYQDKPGWNAPHLVIQVENLEESMKKVTDSGGKIEGKPEEIPQVGTYVSFTDSEGNVVGMLQPPNQ